jgi:hypothetical protein
MTDNLHIIKELLRFESEDDFYHLQILKRKKENPELGSNSQVIKTYYIRSVEHLEESMGEIKLLCDYHSARAYINLNVRSFEKSAFQTMKKLSDIIMNRDYKSARRAYESVVGVHSTGRDKSWIVDIDTKDNDIVNGIKDAIEACEPIDKEKSIAFISTKNGYHLITKPFNRFGLPDLIGIDIHTNNPTILYTP